MLCLENASHPSLEKKERSFVADVYRPDGKRTTVSFGPTDVRTEGEIYAAFGKWLDLFNLYPHKVLAFSSPYEAIEQVVNPKTIATVGQLLDNYRAACEQQLSPARTGEPSSTLLRVQQLKK